MIASSKTLPFTLATLTVALLGTPGCRAIEGIFKAGVWTGVIAILFFVALAFGISRLFVRT